MARDHGLGKLLAQVSEAMSNETREPVTTLRAAESSSTGAGNRNKSAARDLMMGGRSPVGAMSTALEGIINRNDGEIETLKAQLAGGQTVLEVDPDLVDDSFVLDRMASAGEAFEVFKQQIKENGQQVPILVRPSPDAVGRYQVAYGHRRLRAARDLKIKVRAVVKTLSDSELVVAQGQENSARTDLSFIEKATFAARLEDRGFDRSTILAALSTNKGDLSKLISVATKIPAEVIEAIGSAPGIGRPRWLELLALIQRPQGAEKACEIVRKPDFQKLTSDDRFLSLASKLLRKEEAPAAPSDYFWRDAQGRRVARISDGEHRFSVHIDKTVEPEFGAFLASKLDELYDAFRRSGG